MARPVDPDAFHADLSHIGALKTRLSVAPDQGEPWIQCAQALVCSLSDVLTRKRPLTRLQIKQLRRDLSAVVADVERRSKGPPNGDAQAD